MSIEYPMHVVSLSRLLTSVGALGRRRAVITRPAPVAQAQGHAVPWTPSLGGEVIFGHDRPLWTGWKPRPDRHAHRDAVRDPRPSAARLNMGQVELRWMSQLVLGGRRVVKAVGGASGSSTRGCAPSASSRCRSTAARPTADAPRAAARRGSDAAPKFDNPKQRARDQLARGVKYAPNHSSRWIVRRCGGAWSRRSTSSASYIELDDRCS